MFTGACKNKGKWTASWLPVICREIYGYFLQCTVILVVFKVSKNANRRLVARIRNNHGKRAITVRAIKALLYCSVFGQSVCDIVATTFKAFIVKYCPFTSTFGTRSFSLIIYKKKDPLVFRAYEYLKRCALFTFTP